MTDSELNQWCLERIPEAMILEIPQEMFDKLTEKSANLIVEQLGGTKMLRLPEREITFFEWLKKEDEAVWSDLWEDDLFEPYVVSISMLPYLITEHENGFPICDLEENTNFYFSMEFMQDEESKMVLEAAKNRVLDKQEISLAQKLALEISLAPIDIWRFAYKHRVTIEDAKKAVAELVDDFALVHLKESEYISQASEI
jgi:hypothetical protein